MNVLWTGHFPIETGQDDEPGGEWFRREIGVETKFTVEKTVAAWIDLKSIRKNAWRQNKKDDKVIRHRRGEKIIHARVRTECLSCKDQRVQRQANAAKNEENDQTITRKDLTNNFERMVHRRCYI